MDSGVEFLEEMDTKIKELQNWRTNNMESFLKEMGITQDDKDMDDVGPETNNDDVQDDRSSPLLDSSLPVNSTGQLKVVYLFVCLLFQSFLFKLNLGELAY
jgi:hypothetical protein